MSRTRSQLLSFDNVLQSEAHFFNSLSSAAVPGELEFDWEMTLVLRAWKSLLLTSQTAYADMWTDS